MKQVIITIGISALMFFAVEGIAQQINKSKSDNPTSLGHQKQQSFYRKTLQIDSLKAVQVSEVQDAYKTALYALVADTSLNEAARRVQISALMEVKNQKLRSLLTPAQQEKIIPTTERMPARTESPR